MPFFCAREKAHGLKNRLPFDPVSSSRAKKLRPTRPVASKTVEICNKFKAHRAYLKRKVIPAHDADNFPEPVEFGDAITCDHKILNEEEESRTQESNTAEGEDAIDMREVNPNINAGGNGVVGADAHTNVHV